MAGHGFFELDGSLVRSQSKVVCSHAVELPKANEEGMSVRCNKRGLS